MLLRNSSAGVMTIDCHGLKLCCDLEPRSLTASDRVRSGYDNRLGGSVSSGTIFKHLLFLRLR